MNVVVGNSIKIETNLDIGTELFKEQFFNTTKWPEFLFSSQSELRIANDATVNAFEYLGNNRLILEHNEILVDTIIIKSSDLKTRLLIVVDTYDDGFDLNEIVNNIIENSVFQTTNK